MSAEPNGVVPYRGEFRYVFYAPQAKYEATLLFYRDVLQFPVIGGFSHGKFFQASTGVIEVIAELWPDRLRYMLLDPKERYEPPRGGFLLIEVEDLSGLYQTVVDAGVELMQEPKDWPWLFRDFKVKDPCGNVLCFFCRLPG